MFSGWPIAGARPTSSWGAWGCGVFSNDPKIIAGLFRDALAPGGPFAEVFPRVTFAIRDRSPGRGVFQAFHDALTLPG